MNDARAVSLCSEKPEAIPLLTCCVKCSLLEGLRVYSAGIPRTALGWLFLRPVISTLQAAGRIGRDVKLVSVADLCFRPQLNAGTLTYAIETTARGCHRPDNYKTK